MEQLKKERSIAKSQFTRKLNIFNKCVIDNDHIDVLNDALQELNLKFEKLELLHNQMVMLVNTELETNDLDKYITNVELLKIKANNDFLSIKDLRNKDKKNAENVQFCVKKLAAPSFDGTMRLFPLFVSDYERLMESRYGKDLYILKGCLSEKVQDQFNWVDDYDTMWNRLKEKFGSAPKIVDFVVSKIKGLKVVPEGNNSKLLDLINCVENSWYDLKRVGQEREIENNTVVTLIEKLLPSNIMRDWALKRQSIDDSNVFHELSKFLLIEKKAIEYLEDSVRKNNSTVPRIVNNVSVDYNVEEKEYDANYVNLVKKLQENQESQNQKFNESISSLTLAFNNLAKSTDTRQLDRIPSQNINGASSSWCFLHQTHTHDFSNCFNFKRLDKNSKLECLKKNRICFSCLESGHVSNFCNNRQKCNFRNQMGLICGKYHHILLHDIFSFSSVNHHFFLSQSSVSHVNQQNLVLLPIGLVKSKGYPITTLYDSGANLSLISHSLANYLRLKGKDIELSIVKVGNVIEKVKSKLYHLTLVDLYGIEWNLNVCGLDQITTDHSHIEMKEIANILEINQKEIERPKSKVDLLIGVDYCSILPQVVKSIDNLQLLQNSFGFCVRGVINSFGVNMNQNCNVSFSINHIVCNVNDIVINHSQTFVKSVEDFFTIENMGVDCNLKCGGCRCGKCSLDNNLSVKEQRETDLIINGLSYDCQEKKWTTMYPWIRSPTELPNNFSLAFSFLKSTEKRLSKLGLEYAMNYNDQFTDMLNRGVALKLDKSVVDSYKGPIHYLPHHGIHKPSSSSTPLRIVFNPSLSFAGHVLNDYYAKGPDVLNDMLGVLLRFRLGSIAVVGDIKKMYNAIFLSLLDQHTHRFLWRNMNINQDPDHYILLRVTFGDRPSGAIAIIALRKTAEMFKDEFPESASILISNSYVDDIIFSVDDMSTAESRMSEIEYILKEGGFDIKEWIISKKNYNDDHMIQIADKDEEKVLGVVWNSKLDKFIFKINLNFSKKNHIDRINLNIKEDDFNVKFPQFLTKRLILSQIASLYDPLGLLTPFTLQAKFLMRELILEQRSFDNVTDKKKWDIPISNNLYNKWRAYFYKMFQISKITFERCVKHKLAKGKPILVLFSDGSKYSYGSCAYIRWQLQDNTFWSRLLMAKSRLAPTRQITIPQIELNGCVMSCRLRQKCEHELKIEFESIIHISDSSIVLSQIANESSRFQTYVANRLAEIHRKSNNIDWFWTSSDDNVADHTTRFLDPSEMGYESIWQCGPTFLSLPINMWPIKKCANHSLLPDLLKESITINKINSVKVECIKNDNSNICINVADVQYMDTFAIDISKFNDFHKLLRVTARIINVMNNKSFKCVLIDPSVDDLKAAERFWIKHVQSEVINDWEVRYKRLGPKLNQDGLIIVGDRLSNWLKDNWNQSEFILLTPNHLFTKLYIQFLHYEDHSGIESTLAKLQSKFWVPRARKIIKFVKSKCIKCRLIDKKCLEQCMGPLPQDRLKPSPPFYRISLDLFGPFLVKDTVKRRTTKKVYGLICNCMLSRAIHLELVEGYDMFNFLLSFKRFISIRGFPGYVYSDNGSQLVAANKELRDMTKNWDMSELSKFGSKQGLTWIFNKSANAPFQNGCSESLIRLVKRGILMSIGNNIISFGELLTTFYEIANLVNERPIGLKPGNDLSLGTYLCPNDLILGRNTIRVPNEIYDESNNDFKRYKFINEIVTSFWNKWNRDFFPTLIVRQKWHVKVRNVRVGDIVLVQEKNSFKGKWKLAEVIHTYAGSDDKVRNVTIRYKLNKSGPKYHGQADSIVNRSVHSLVIILPVEEQ